jgi:hypothetical protein
MSAKFKAKLQIGWVPFGTVTRILEQNFCPALFRGL